MLNNWPKEGCTGKRRETVPCPHMLAEVIRRPQESRTEATKMVFEEALNIVKSEGKLGRTSPTQDVQEGKSIRKTKHAETVPCGTEDCNSSQRWRRRVRKSGNTALDGTCPGTRWSRRDTQRNGSVHVDDNVEPREHGSVITTNPSKTVPTVVVEAARVAGGDKNWENLKNTMDSQIDGQLRNRRVRKVGTKLTATLLLTFSRICHEWNRSKIVQLEARYLVRVSCGRVGDRRASEQCLDR